MASKPKPNVIEFRARPTFEAEEEAPVTAAPAPETSVTTAPQAAGIDLSGKPKVWFAIGAGRTGKSTLLRWAAEISANQGGAPIVAAADPQNRSLKNSSTVSPSRRPTTHWRSPAGLKGCCATRWTRKRQRWWTLVAAIRRCINF